MHRRRGVVVSNWSYHGLGSCQHSGNLLVAQHEPSPLPDTISDRICTAYIASRTYDRIEWLQPRHSSVLIKGARCLENLLQYLSGKWNDVSFFAAYAVSQLQLPHRDGIRGVPLTANTRASQPAPLFSQYRYTRSHRCPNTASRRPPFVLDFSLSGCPSPGSCAGVTVHLRWGLRWCRKHGCKRRHDILGPALLQAGLTWTLSHDASHSSPHPCTQLDRGVDNGQEQTTRLPTIPNRLNLIRRGVRHQGCHTNRAIGATRARAQEIPSD